MNSRELMDRYVVHKDYSGINLFSESFSHVFLVYDENVRHLAEKVAESLGAKLRSSKSITISDKSKTLRQVCVICEWLLEEGADRNALLIAVGGGTTSDIAGFAASIYKRGIAFAIVPTTLLAMVDASIGGKNGVNLKGYKNILGSIRQPLFVYTCLSALVPLPQKEFLNGVAEMLKTFLIADRQRYEESVTFFAAGGVIPADSAKLADFIMAAAAIKCRIVTNDPCEKGPRRVLNLGHTVAHALESRKTNTLSHGEAVAIGIIASARISEALGACRKGLSGKLIIDFMQCGLPTELPCRPSALTVAVSKDKKAQDGKINFVLISRPGKVEVRLLAPDEILSFL